MHLVSRENTVGHQHDGVKVTLAPSPARMIHRLGAPFIAFSQLPDIRICRPRMDRYKIGARTIPILTARPRARVPARLPRRELIHTPHAHNPPDERTWHELAHEPVQVRAEADPHNAAAVGAIDDVENGGVQITQRGTSHPADPARRDGRGRGGDEVAPVGLAGRIGPRERLGRRAQQTGLGGPRGEAGEVKGAQLEVGHGDAEGPQLGGEDVGEGREGRAHGGLGSVEGRVDGRDDGWGEDEHARRGPVGGGQPRREQGQEGLDGQDRFEEVRVEEVGEARGRDGGDGRGLVAEGRDEDDGLEGEVVWLCARNGGVRCLQVLGESLDRGARAGRLCPNCQLSFVLWPVRRRDLHL